MLSAEREEMESKFKEAVEKAENLGMLNEAAEYLKRSQPELIGLLLGLTSTPDVAKDYNEPPVVPIAPKLQVFTPQKQLLPYELLLQIKDFIEDGNTLVNWIQALVAEKYATIGDLSKILEFKDKIGLDNKNLWPILEMAKTSSSRTCAELLSTVSHLFMHIKFNGYVHRVWSPALVRTAVQSNRPHISVKWYSALLYQPMADDIESCRINDLTIWTGSVQPIPPLHCFTGLTKLTIEHVLFLDFEGVGLLVEAIKSSTVTDLSIKTVDALPDHCIELFFDGLVDSSLHTFELFWKKWSRLALSSLARNLSRSNIRHLRFGRFVGRLIEKLADILLESNVVSLFFYHDDVGEGDSNDLRFTFHDLEPFMKILPDLPQLKSVELVSPIFLRDSCHFFRKCDFGSLDHLILRFFDFIGRKPINLIDHLPHRDMFLQSTTWEEREILSMFKRLHRIKSYSAEYHETSYFESLVDRFSLCTRFFSKTELKAFPLLLDIQNRTVWLGLERCAQMYIKFYKLFSKQERELIIYM